MKVLFLSAHTDDVEFGGGGTLVKMKEEGHDILSVVFSTAEDSLPEDLPKDTLRKEFLNVMAELGFVEKNYMIFNFRVRRLQEHRQEILEELVRIKKDFSPNLVIGPSSHDYHQDHYVLSQEMIRAFKNTSSILSYELPWNHVQFDTQFFVGLSEDHISKKIELINKYESQMHMKRKYFDPEMIRGWARMRGCQINTDFAEAYEVIRWIY